MDKHLTTVTVCVGSSCHLKGARELIMRFNALLKEHHLQDFVILKGSFCMERCGEGVNWQINGEVFSSSNVDDAVQLFRERVIEPATNCIAGDDGKAELHGTT